MARRRPLAEDGGGKGSPPKRCQHVWTRGFQGGPAGRVQGRYARLFLFFAPRAAESSRALTRAASACMPGVDTGREREADGLLASAVAASGTETAERRQGSDTRASLWQCGFRARSELRSCRSGEGRGRTRERSEKNEMDKGVGIWHLFRYSPRRALRARELPALTVASNEVESALYTL